MAVLVAGDVVYIVVVFFGHGCRQGNGLRDGRLFHEVEGDDAAGLLYVEQRLGECSLVHRERGGVELVLGSGVGVAAVRCAIHGGGYYFFVVVNLIRTYQPAVGGQYVHAWGALDVVDGIVGQKERIVEVDMIDEHSVPHVAQVDVPFIRLYVLDDDVFVAGCLAVLVDAVGLAAVSVDVHQADALALALLGKGFNLHPSHVLAFPCGIGGGAIAVVGVFAVVHQVPVFHGGQELFLGSCRGGIEVGQAHAMRELVAEESDAVYLRHACEIVIGTVDDGGTEIQFAMHAIAIHLLAVERSIGIASRLGPDGVGVVAREILAIAGIDDVYQVYLAVVVAIVLAEVDALLLCQPAHLGNEFAHVVVLAGAVVFHRA